MSFTALYVSVQGTVRTWIDTYATLTSCDGYRTQCEVESDVRTTLLALRIHHESRNNNDVTILCGVDRPRAYCSRTRRLAIKEVLMSARWKHIFITRDRRFGPCRSKFAVSMDVNGLGMSRVRTHGLRSGIRDESM